MNMDTNVNNRFALAKEQFTAGEIDKFQYAKYLNSQHLALFDYQVLLAGTDVASIQISADGLVVNSASHGIGMLLDTIDMHATPYSLLDFGQYEVEETRFLKSVLKDGEVFLDVGANLGWYSLVLGKQYPNARIVAFEPIPSTVAKLERNIAFNQLSNIEVQAVGLFNSQDNLDFLFAPDVSGATSLKVAGQPRGNTAIERVQCPTTTLDLFCASRELQPSLLKIDVEGAELMVVQGADQVLQGVPVVLMELLRKWSKAFDYHPNDVFALMARYGYQAWVFTASGQLERCAEVTDDTVQTNFVFLHNDKHAPIIQQWAAGAEH